MATKTPNPDEKGMFRVHIVVHEGGSFILEAPSNERFEEKMKLATELTAELHSATSRKRDR